MNTTKLKNINVKPKYIKNERGATTQIYLDIKAYESILDTIKSFKKKKKKISAT